MEIVERITSCGVQREAFLEAQLVASSGIFFCPCDELCRLQFTTPLLCRQRPALCSLPLSPLFLTPFKPMGPLGHSLPSPPIHAIGCEQRPCAALPRPAAQRVHPLLQGPHFNHQHAVHVAQDRHVHVSSAGGSMCCVEGIVHSCWACLHPSAAWAWGLVGCMCSVGGAGDTCVRGGGGGGWVRGGVYAGSGLYTAHLPAAQLLPCTKEERGATSMEIRLA